MVFESHLKTRWPLVRYGTGKLARWSSRFAGLLLAGVLSLCPSLLKAQSLTVRRVNDALFSRPILATHAPGDFERLYVAEQHTGQIRILDLKTGSTLAQPFLDLNSLTTGGEQGLLGLAFHPNFATNGLFYVNYTDATGDSVVAEYQAPSRERANPTSARRLFQFDQPFPNHNAGWMAFSPVDNYLYIATGDGGSAGDPRNVAQNLNSPLGKMLRINVDSRSHGQFGIPLDNPFYNATAPRTGLADAVWAYGLRNPWRNSFDRANGDLYIADVGQGAWEEVNYQSAVSDGGENYGWRVREGNACYDNSGANGNPPCNATTFTNPIQQYPHVNGPTGGFSITGGYVYRGALENLRGQYFYGDYVSEQIWTLSHNGTAASNVTNRTNELRPATGPRVNQISSFGEDAGGGLYVVDLSGEVFEIVPRRSQVTGQFLAYPQAAQPSGNASTTIIASDKRALLPGQTGSFNNTSGAVDGLTNVVVDLDHLAAPEQISLADFQFRLGTTNDVSSWVPAPTPQGLDVQLNLGESGADRLAVRWEGGQITNTWLEVTLLANERTGLLSPHTFYFGHALGDVGQNENPGGVATAAWVDSRDLEVIQAAANDFLHPLGPNASADLNHDGFVDGSDFAIVRDNLRAGQAVLPFITPTQPPTAAMLVPEPGSALAILAVLLGLPACRAQRVRRNVQSATKNH